MNTKNLTIAAIIFLGALHLSFYQNCARVAVNDPNLASKGDPVASATDNQGQPVPVQVDQPSAGEPSTPPPPVSSQPPPTPTLPPVVGGDDPTSPPVVDGPSEDLIKACGLDMSTIHFIVDLAQFQNQEIHLDLLKGKTLVYNSDPTVALKSLTIDTAVGRTILCGCKVDKLDVKKGRLEVYSSEIREIGSRNGVLIFDDLSVLPPGA